VAACGRGASPIAIGLGPSIIPGIAMRECIPAICEAGMVAAMAAPPVIAGMGRLSAGVAPAARRSGAGPD